MVKIIIPDRELIPIDDLKVDSDNPNTMSKKQLERLKTSIKKYGFIVPIITNKDLLIADGEQRLTVAKSLSMTQVPIIRLPVEDVDRRLLRQVLNKLRGEHELIADAREFEKIIAAGREDELKHLLDLSDSQLEKYLREIREVKPEEYEVPELDKIETDIKRGDIYSLGKHRLMCGDATQDIPQLMGESKADMVLTDPPYGIDVVRNSGVLQGIGGSKRATFGKIGFSVKCKTHSYFPIIGDDKPFDPTHLLNLAPLVAIFGANYFADKLPISAGWWVWDKAGGREWRDDFANAELIWSNDTHHAKIYRHLWKGMTREGNRKSELHHRVHPTQKPVGLLQQIIIDHTKNPSIILDPYGGSGSTLIACEQIGRTCYMMEIDPRYCQVIVDRWEAYTGKNATIQSHNGGDP